MGIGTDVSPSERRHDESTVGVTDPNQGRSEMPRYLIEREFSEGLGITADPAGAAACRAVVQNNAEDGVTWVHSYVTPDRRLTFCIYDGPSPEAVRHAAIRNKLPISRISEVLVLDPYFHH
jgi:hypothetical protein